MWLAEDLIARIPFDRPATLWLVIGPRSIEWGLQTRARGRARWLECERITFIEPGARPTLDALLNALESLPAMPAHGARAGGLHVRLSEQWLACSIVPWSDALTQQHAAAGFIRSQLASQGFDPGEDALIRFDEDTAPYGSPRVALACPQPLLRALEHCAGRWQQPLVSVQPWPLSLWPRLAAGVEAVAFIDDDHILFAGGVRGGVQDLARRPRTPGLSDEDDLRVAWQRLVMRSPHWAACRKVGVLALGSEPLHAARLHVPFVPIEAGPPDRASAVAASLQILGDAPRGPTAWASRPLDMLPPARRPGVMRLGVWVALSGLLALVGHEIMLNQTRLETVERQLSEAPAAPVSALLTKDEMARVPAINGTIRQLNLPLPALMQALIPPRDITIAVLSIDTIVEPASGRARLKITAQANDSADVTRYVDFISGRAPFSRVYLLRHELPEGQGAMPNRFSVEAVWTQ